jgi:ribosomal protein S18 acetylase RimI-like enzyme
MHITLRPANADDLPFARSLYLDNMRAVTARVVAWDEARQTASFDTRFLPAEVSVVVLDGENIGWMQVAEREDEFFLKQFFIAPRFQRRGIGTKLLQALIERAAQAGKAVTLGVVKGNPARSLYERHGFQVTSEDQSKVYMEKEPPSRRLGRAKR